MDKVEKIKAEIERRKSLADELEDDIYFFARSDAYVELLNFIDSLEEEPKKTETVYTCDNCLHAGNLIYCHNF